jgi:hypothetical protein
MHRALLSVVLGLGLLPGLAAAQPVGQGTLSEADEQQAQAWQEKINEHLDRDDMAQAQALAEVLYQLQKEKHGPEHWQTWDARFQVDEVRRLSKRRTEERRQLRQARALDVKATQHYQQRRFADAEQLLRQALAIRQKALPPGHPDLALSLNNLAATLRGQGKSAEAERLGRQAVAIWHKALPPGHPHLALSLNNLANTLHAQANYAEAEQLHRQALAIWQKALPPGHPDLALSLNNLAATLREQGKSAEAERLDRQALAIWHKALPPGHPDLALSLNNLANTLHAQANYAEAEQLHRQALAILQKALPPGHPDLALSLNNLATSLLGQGKAAEAEPLLRQALAIRQKALPPGHPDLAVSLNNLAETLRAQAKSAEAEPLHRHALAIRQKALPPGHPHLAASLNNLAATLRAQGKSAEAEQLCRQALAIQQKALPPGHPHLALSLNNLAATLHAQGKYAEAEQVCKRAAEHFEITRLHAGASGGERAQFASQFVPQLALAALRARRGRGRQAWAAAEAQLARGLLDDLSASRQADLDPDQRQRLGQLQEELAVLSKKILDVHLAPERHAAKKKELQRWLARSRELAGGLGALAAEQSRKQVAPLTQAQRNLPADSALLLWVDFAETGRREGGEHWGCVVRSAGEPAWVPLPGSGDKEGWMPDDNSLPRRLREALSSPSGGDWRKLADELYHQRLQPLEPHLKGVSRLIAVPAGWMAGVPVEVLTDRYQISYTPSGTIHARLRERHRPLEPSLLALGDPAFRRRPPPEPPNHGLYVQLVLPGSNGARAGLHAGDVLLVYNGVKLQRFEDLKPVQEGAGVAIQLWRQGQVQAGTLAPGKLGVVLAKEPAAQAVAKQRQADQWLVQRSGDYKDLPGTRLEVEALAGLFTKKRLLLGSEASEQRLEQLQAAGELAGYRILHFATHGEMHPSRPSLCALILAQDQLPDPAEQIRQGKKVYDGRLTAEALLQWKLDADLVVLSACETGLGPHGGGEGFLGFSQVLFRQGARSVILSLWKVDDTATALLMKRFYENLLGKRGGLKGPLGRAAALREAQHWLRDLSRAEAEKQAAALAAGVPRSTVVSLGGRPVVPAPRPGVADDRPFAHPYYWAAFILLGDPD